MSTWGERPTDAAAFQWPVWNDDASRDERFIGFVNALLPLCQPTHPDDVAAMERFSRIGIGAGLEPPLRHMVKMLPQGGAVTSLLEHPALEPIAPAVRAGLAMAGKAVEPIVGAARRTPEVFREEPDASVRQALRWGVVAARDKLERACDLDDKVNGWSASDPFGEREKFAGDQLQRCVGAMLGWGGNDKVEAFYPLLHEDSEGEPLSGEHRYTLRFDDDPPVRAFWSVTAYNTSYDGVAGYLVENPIDRFLINSTTEGLVRGDDGSLTLFIQHDQPETVEGRANWLPVPRGDFYLIARLYWPDAPALEGTWVMPPVDRV